VDASYSQGTRDLQCADSTGGEYCRPSACTHKFVLVVVKGVRPAERGCKRPNGGRTWRAHFAFTRINTTPTILPKKFEDLRDVGALMSIAGQRIRI